MREYSNPDNWRPAGDMTLEDNAWEVVRSTTNNLVVAGPGAGKTELLAQRACYLLQTNICPEPMRILAISFKRDAASNLRARVELRCGRELASRFDSFTFDAFAKSLVDRFRWGLPPQYRPPADYDIASDHSAFKGIIQQLKNGLEPPPGLPNRGVYRNIDPGQFADKKLCADLIDPGRIPMSAIEWAAHEMWQKLIHAEDCFLTFDMIKRLATYVLPLNPLLLKAMQTTYSHVFLDEFQDTTYIQYDLLKVCFLGSKAVLTGVGDDKQRIMLWANAMKDGFDRFQRDFRAARLPLLCNHRSDSELVRIQQFLIQAIDPTSEPTVASEKNKAGEGICEVLFFDSEDDEATKLSAMIAELVRDGINPGHICLLTRIRPDAYCRKLLTTLSERGIKCRVETEYQDLMRDKLAVAILAILYLASQERSPAHWEIAMSLLSALAGLDAEDDLGMYSQEDRLAHFIDQLRNELCNAVTSESEMRALIGRIAGFYGAAAIRAYFPQYRNENSYEFAITTLCRLLWRDYSSTSSWSEALRSFEGKETVPAMTIHKCKGLEYDTLFFIGLEDKAWLRFAEQREEHTCAFFVAFSRAKKRVYFTFCRSRAVWDPKRPQDQSREQISSLYRLLLRAGVAQREAG